MPDFNVPNVKIGPDVSVAIGLGSHQRTRAEMARDLCDRLAARPQVRFAEIVAGRLYSYTSYSGSEHSEILGVLAVAPAGGQARVVRYDKESTPSREHKIYKGTYSGTFTELDAVLAAHLGLTHRDVVKAAAARGLDVPARVRCEHPGLFLDIPERFACGAEWNARTAAERVREHLAMDWGKSWPRRPVSAEAVDLWIAEAHRRLTHSRSEAVRRVAMNRDTREDYDRVEEEFRDLVDFYRWLRPHVSPGGVFYVAESLAADEEATK